MDNQQTCKQPVIPIQVAWKDSNLENAPVSILSDLVEMTACYVHGTRWQMSEANNLHTFNMYAKEHGVQGVVTALDNMGFLVQSKEEDTSLSNQYIANLIQHERFSQLLKKINAICDNRNIKYSVFKGPALVDQVYADGGVRSYGDIDIFIESREELERLLEDEFFQNDEIIITEQPNSFSHPGRVHVSVNDLPIEFFFPIDVLCDPMFDFIAQHRQEFFTDNQDYGYYVPPKTIHFIFLLLHLQKHLCTRHLWHLDIVLFFHLFQNDIDMHFVHRELERLQLCQFSHYLSLFYKKEFGVDLNLFPNWQQTGWNTEIIQKMASIEQLHGNIGVKQLQKFPITTGIVASIRFFIITDPQHQSLLGHSTGVKWLASLLCLRIKLTNPLFIGTLSSIMLLAKPALTHLVKYVIIRRYKRQ